MKDYEKVKQDAVVKLTRSLGLKASRLTKLTKSDDWTFIIGAHALVESALNWAISRHLKPHDVSEHVAKLSLSGRTGKIQLAQSLSLLDDDDETFIWALTKARNRVVHNVRHIDFEFGTFLHEMSKAERQRYSREALIYFNTSPELIAQFEKQPRTYIWPALINLLTIISLQDHTRRLERKLAKRNEELMRLQLKTAHKAKP